MKYRIPIKPKSFIQPRLSIITRNVTCQHYVLCPVCEQEVYVDAQSFKIITGRRIYMDASYMEYRKQIRDFLMRTKREVIREGNVSIGFTFCNPDRRSDWDNLCKAVADSIQDRKFAGVVERGAILKNDNQIKACHGVKIIYDKHCEPYVEFDIEKIE